MLEQCQCSPGRLLGAILPSADGRGRFHTNKLGELPARDSETISQRGDVNCSVCHGYQIVHFALLSQVPNALAFWLGRQDFFRIVFVSEVDSSQWPSGLFDKMGSECLKIEYDYSPVVLWIATEISKRRN